MTYTGAGCGGRWGRAIPAYRKKQERKLTEIEPGKECIDRILESDRQAPRKQRQNARRIWHRLV